MHAHFGCFSELINNSNSYWQLANPRYGMISYYQIYVDLVASN